MVTVTRELLDSELAALDGSSSEDSNSKLHGDIGYNFHFSGDQRSVNRARGAVLREFPRDNRQVIKVARTDILDTSLALRSQIKSSVQARIQEIVTETRARVVVMNEIATGPDAQAPLATFHGVEEGGADGSETVAQHDGPISNSPSSADQETENTRGKRPTVPGADVGFGLEGERLCELVITGSHESVQLAKVLLLVMIDVLVSSI
jgi:hypothetical protein